MNLAFSTIAFAKLSLAETLRQIAEAGYGGVEILADVPHAHPSQMDSRRRHELAALLDELRLTVCALNAQMFPTAGDEADASPATTEDSLRQQRIEYTRDCIYLARDLEVPSVLVGTPGPAAQGPARQAATELYRDEIRTILDVADRARISVLIKAAPARPAEDIEDFLGHRRLGLCIDIPGFRTSAVHGLRKYIRYVRLSNIAAGADIRPAFAALKDIGYDGWVTVALREPAGPPREAALKAFGLLQPLL